MMIVGAPLFGQMPQSELDAEVDDPFSREAAFIDYLLEERLFAYANRALDELRRDFPDQQERIPVVEATVHLRQGRTEQVEEMLEGLNVEQDEAAQAILLQLAMTYEALGRREAARDQYLRFLEVNEGREITDPDVLRFFAGAALRLATILQETGQYEEAANALARVITDIDSDVLKRKFRIHLIQTHLDHGLTLEGSAREERLRKAREEVREILWGANDNYWFMAMAQNFWLDHLEGDTEGALEGLEDIRSNARRLEEKLEEGGVPKSEFPRAAMRSGQGVILFDGAQAALAQGDERRAREQAASAANQLYNAFLMYEGNDYARRAGLKFERVRSWIREEFNQDIQIGQRDPGATEQIFKRQLDLAEELVRARNLEEAEGILLNALSQYPITQYTLGALNTLGRIWMEQERDWELITLSHYVADLFPDNTEAANMLLRWGRRMFEEEDEFGIEQVLGMFGRHYPGHGRAPVMLFEIARRAEDRGEMGTARRFYDEVVEYHPGSEMATRVLTMRAAEAMEGNNYERAVEIFRQVRDQAPPGFLRAQASFGIADAQLRSDDEEMRQEGLAGLEALRERLSDRASIFYRGGDAERSERLLARVRFNIGQNLIRFAGRQDSDELRQRAVNELTAFLEDYPGDRDRAPRAMYGLGRIYLQQGRFDAATETFEELAREYRDSEYGRDALFSLVSAALEENQVEVARDAVRQMIEEPEAFEIGQIFQVGGLMLEHEKYAEARDSFELVIDHPQAESEAGMRQRARMNLGKASMGLEEYERASEVFGRLIEENPNSVLVLEAGILNSEALLAQGMYDEADEALLPVSRVLRSRPDPVVEARMGMMAGRISLAKGADGQALIDFYTVGLSEPKSREHGELVRDAIHRALEQAIPMAEGGDRAKWGIIADLAEQYVDSFPMDRDVPEMRGLQSRAESQMR